MGKKGKLQGQRSMNFLRKIVIITQPQMSNHSSGNFYVVGSYELRGKYFHAVIGVKGVRSMNFD